MRLFYRVRYHPWVVKARGLVPHRWVNLFKHWPAAILANLVYGWPSRKLVVIGVTGTDGKTTTATWLHHLLVQAGFSAALVSTVAAKLGKKEIDTGLHVTAPDHFPLQRLLRQMIDQKFTHVVLEVTSHGLAQHRFWGVRFTGGVLTNVAEDHLDYHGSWKEYLAAKAKLFAHTQFAVLNAEDKSFRYLRRTVSGRVIPYGLKHGKVRLRDWQEFFPPLPAYNQANLLAAVAAARELGVETSQIRQAFGGLPQIRGRLEVMQAQPFLIVVDFAHTPQGLEKVLEGLRPQVKRGGRLIAVFGCAGERDKTRRKMGKVSAQLADIIIITAEDPRTEGVKHISAEIARWARKGGAKEISKIKYQRSKRLVIPLFIRIDDRGEAIEFAIKIAGRGDVVGIFGKGHERSMAFGRTEYPWSDQRTVKTILRACLRSLFLDEVGNVLSEKLEW